MITVFIQN